MKKEDIKIPPIGLTYSRSDMPQLGAKEDFLHNLQKHKIKFKNDVVNSHELRSSQGEFNIDSIHSIMHEPHKASSAVVVSRDNYVVDGHHRWAANYNMNKPTKVVRVDLPILELLRVAKTFSQTKYKNIKNVNSAIKNVVKEALITKKNK
jgi:hypothetical protein